MRDVLLETGAERAVVRLLVQSLKLVVIGLTAVLIVVGGLKYFNHVRGSAAEAEGVGQTATVTIKKTDGEPDVARKLHAAGLIQSQVYFKTLLKIKGGTLVPGTYRLPKGSSVSQIIAVLTR